MSRKHNMRDKIKKICGFGVKNTALTQSDFMIAALTENGKVIVANHQGIWVDFTPEENTENPEKLMDNLNNTMPVLPNHVTLAEMVNHSIKVLYTHGFITFKEREKIANRLIKRFKKEMGHQIGE